MDQAQREQVALFRFEVIAPLLSVKPGRGQLKSVLQSQAKKRWDIPFSLKESLSAKTIEEWYYKYLKGGLAALQPAKRKDAGESRKISLEVGDTIKEWLSNDPELTGKIILDELVAKGLSKPGELTLSDYYRFRKSQGLDKVTAQGKEDKKAFSFELPNDCWQSDMMFGPYLAQRDGSRRRTYLYGILDDCTRLGCHAQFYFDQGQTAFVDCFKQALMKRGVPKKLYVDNAKVFRSRVLRLSAAQLGICMTHSRAHRPEGRGKIERWFRTVRDNFIRRLDVSCLNDLDHLNQLLWAWIEGEYHQTFHKGIDEAPIDKWIRLSDHVKPLPSTVDLDRTFLHKGTRRVKKDGTFQLKGKRFEAGVEFIGEKIQILFDPYDLRVVWIESEHHKSDVEAYPLDAVGNRTVSRQPDPPKKKKEKMKFSSLERLRRQMSQELNTDNDDEEGDANAAAPTKS